MTGAALSSPAAFAQGGGPDPKDVGTNSTKSTSRKKPKRKLHSFSQGQLLEFSRKRIAKLHLQITTYETHDIEIKGFSKDYPKILVQMLDLVRPLARRLIDDMRGLTKRKDRIARLNKEIRLVKKRIAELSEAFERARKKNFKSVMEETRGRITDHGIYLNGVKYWRRAPKQGSL